MPNQIFRITSVTRSLTGGAAVSEALGFPELSVLDDTEKRRLDALKFKTFLEDAELLK